MNSGTNPDAGWSGKAVWGLSALHCSNRLWEDKEWKPLLTFQCISIGIAHILRLLVSAIVV